MSGADLTFARPAALIGLLLVSASLVACARPAPRVAHEPTAQELVARGAFFAENGDDFAAEQYFEAARTAGYPEGQVVRKLVGVCVQSGRLEHALNHARDYLEREPDDWLMRHLVASVHFAKGDRTAAREELELLLAEHPDHAESHFLLGMLLRDAFAERAQAKQSLSRYLELAPAGSHAKEVKAWIRRSELLAKPEPALEEPKPEELAP